MGGRRPRGGRTDERGRAVIWRPGWSDADETVSLGAARQLLTCRTSTPSKRAQGASKRHASRARGPVDAWKQSGIQRAQGVPPLLPPFGPSPQHPQSTHSPYAPTYRAVTHTGTPHKRPFHESHARQWARSRRHPHH
jgi:hypothetical protein